jgi:hypothetical protein
VNALSTSWSAHSSDAGENGSCNGIEICFGRSPPLCPDTMGLSSRGPKQSVSIQRRRSRSSFRRGRQPQTGRGGNERRARGNALSQRIRKRIEEAFGWIRDDRRARADQIPRMRSRRMGVCLRAAAYNVPRLPSSWWPRHERERCAFTADESIRTSAGGQPACASAWNRSTQIPLAAQRT